jgi:large subunit ribosomal protein L13
MRITKRTKPVKEQWIVINADKQVLGRLATQIANILMGKGKAVYSHDVLCGDFVVVVNAEKVKLTGDKLNKKLYIWHSNYPGGLKERSAGFMLRTKPGFLIKSAVKGMLPKNKLQDRLMTRLKIYTGPDHPHKAQTPASSNS